MIQYNDYELLYLMNEFDEEAETIFYNKYTNLIKARIYKFNIKDRYREDFLQEGLYMLFRAVRTYDEFSNKSFNKYFDLILQRKFMNLLSKENKYYYNVETIQDGDSLCDPTGFVYFDYNNYKFSKLEEKVLYLRERNYRPKEIAEVLDCDIKIIYNCICRIKKKYNK